MTKYRLISVIYKEVSHDKWEFYDSIDSGFIDSYDKSKKFIKDYLGADKFKNAKIICNNDYEYRVEYQVMLYNFVMIFKIVKFEL